MPDPLFIFMLTRNDATLQGAAEAAREAIAAGARHIGFKDAGASHAEARALSTQLKAAGAVIYLEVVSLDEASELASAELALALGVDVLMGGVRPWAVGPRVKDAPVRYFPFVGRVVGHPSVLAGSPDEIAASAREIAALPGVDGLDLLAYRSDHDGGALAREVCAAVAKPVVVAGSIDRLERIAAVRMAGAHAFTVGTAAIEGAFAAAAPGLAGQLAAIQGALRSATPAPAASR
jgi:4-hydroxythreonine-4-phosphate dehydrogenase